MPPPASISLIPLTQTVNWLVIQFNFNDLCVANSMNIVLKITLLDENL